jgi:hypothetical protein
MGKIESVAAILDNELTESPLMVDFIKWDSGKYKGNKMKWDSDNATGEYLIDQLYKNVMDSMILTIQKDRDEKIDKYLKNARVKKLKGDKKGGIDHFQIRYKVDGKAKSLILKNPSVIHTEDTSVGVAKTPVFIFTLQTTEKPTPAGAGLIK